MNGIDLIKSRRSIRAYSDKKIAAEALQKMLEAGMSGPSCVNSQDWSFIVVRDREMLIKMAEANGEAAEPLKKADVGIVVCGNLEKAFKFAPNYWIIDAAIATQNIILAATSLGIGSVWLGTYPQMERVEKQCKLLELPENILPHSIIALGYPADEAEMRKGSRSSYDEAKVHFERW